MQTNKASENPHGSDVALCKKGSSSSLLITRRPPTRLRMVYLSPVALTVLLRRWVTRFMVAQYHNKTKSHSKKNNNPGILAVNKRADITGQHWHRIQDNSDKGHKMSEGISNNRYFLLHDDVFNNFSVGSYSGVKVLYFKWSRPWTVLYLLKNTF